MLACFLVACGSKTADKPADLGSSEAKEITLYVEDQYKALLKQLLKLMKKNQEQKLTSNLGTNLVVLTNFLLTTNQGQAADVMMAPYDRVGSLGTDGQLSEVKLSDGAKTDEKTKSLVTAADGKVYGAPRYRVTCCVLQQRLGKEAPKTFADLENLAKDSKYAFAGEDGKLLLS